MFKKMQEGTISAPKTYCSMLQKQCSEWEVANDRPGRRLKEISNFISLMSSFLISFSPCPDLLSGFSQRSNDYKLQISVKAAPFVTQLTRFSMVQSLKLWAVFKAWLLSFSEHQSQIVRPRGLHPPGQCPGPHRVLHFHPETSLGWETSWESRSSHDALLGDGVQVKLLWSHPQGSSSSPDCLAKYFALA